VSRVERAARHAFRALLVSPVDKAMLGRDFYFRFPHLSLPTLAAYTPAGVEVEIVDEQFHTLPDEALEHADSVCIGEAETLWSSIVEDAMAGRLKTRYRANSFPCIENRPPPRRDLLQIPRAKRFEHISLYFLQTTRGCPFRCSFCAVTSVLGGKLRHRPVAEIEADFLRSRAKTNIESHRGAPWDGLAEDNDQPERKEPRWGRATMGDLTFACHAPIARSFDGTARKRRAKHSLHHLGGYIGRRRKIQVRHRPCGVPSQADGCGDTDAGVPLGLAPQPHLPEHPDEAAGVAEPAHLLRSDELRDAADDSGSLLMQPSGRPAGEAQVTKIMVEPSSAIYCSRDLRAGGRLVDPSTGRRKTVKRLAGILWLFVVLLVLLPNAFAAEVLTNDAVVTMVKAGLGDELILNKIKISLNEFDRSTQALLRLKDAGVSETVIKAMMETAAAPPASAPKAAEAGAQETENAIAMYRQGRVDEAAAAFDKLLAGRPGDDDLKIWKALVLLEQARGKKDANESGYKPLVVSAYKILQPLGRTQATNPDWNFAMAKAFWLNERPIWAKKAAGTALKIRANFAEAQLLLGDLSYDSETQDLALPAGSPQRQTVTVWAGSEARKEYEKALAIPDLSATLLAEVLYKLGKVAAELEKKPGAAREYWERAVAADSNCRYGVMAQNRLKAAPGK